MDNARVEEDRKDKSEPLIWLRAILVQRHYCPRINRIIACRHAKAAEIIQLAVVGSRGGVWAWPRDSSTRCSVLYPIDRVHARHIAGAHVDEDIWGWADHRIERGVDFDGRTCQLGCVKSASFCHAVQAVRTILNNFYDEHNDLDEC